NKHNTLMQIFSTILHKKELAQWGNTIVVCHAEKADRTNSTFGFCRHTSQPLKKPKELFLAHARKKSLRK
ncbi:MAG: hypothetical protein ABR595_10260, partial [Psychroflexus sp.]